MMMMMTTTTSLGNIIVLDSWFTRRHQRGEIGTLQNKRVFAKSVAQCDAGVETMGLGPDHLLSLLVSSCRAGHDHATVNWHNKSETSCETWLSSSEHLGLPVNGLGKWLR